jgi:exodeoxyribonuclease-3
MKIATWNLNSINARKEILINWLQIQQPDIVLLQELKCLADKFPRVEIEDLGYNIAIMGQKSYNGVAILSKYILEDVKLDFPLNPDSSQARYIEAVVSYQQHAIRIASVYVPNGTELLHSNFQYKLAFLESLYKYYKQLLTLDEHLIMGGDFNIAHEALDVFDESVAQENLLYSQVERSMLRKFINLGMYDVFRTLHPLEKKFSWWDYRNFAWKKNIGMRIDYLLCSPSIIDQVQYSYIDDSVRNLEKPSDHAPVILQL